jgi:sugar O-acyltransferase (sialic acid O-acetyltransferase NeuD family)
MNKVIIIGAFHEVIELSEELGLSIVGLVDDIKTGYYMGYKILHNDGDGSVLSPKFNSIPVVITPDICAVRIKLHKRYEEAGFKFNNLISKTAKISKNAHLGKGLIIQHGANISSEAFIGNFVKLNTYGNIMHNSSIGDYTTVAPNAVILGNVKIGKSCYIGSNATVLPNLTICDNTTVGAGAVVVKNINKPGKYAGIPAKLL